MLCAGFAGSTLPVFCEPVTVASLATEARATASAWDAAVKRLPLLARTRNLSAPSLTDVTLSRAMAGSDLRLQLVTWDGRFLFGRAWVEGVDRVPRPVWVPGGAPGLDRVALFAALPAGGGSSPTGATDSVLPIEIAFKESAGKVSGEYRKSGVAEVDTDLLAASSARGAVQGTRRLLSDAAPSEPGLRLAGTGNDATAAEDLLAGAVLFLRLFRALDIVLTQPAVPPAVAWAAGRCVAPAFPAEKALAAAAAAAGGPSLDEPTLDLGLEDGPSAVPSKRAKPAVKPDSKSTSDPAAQARRAAMQRLLARMRDAAGAWAESLAALRCGARGAAESAADPDFGPWYGHGSLATNAAQANVLPADAEAVGNPRWLFVRNWRCVGPFPSNHAEVASWNLPEFFDEAQARYATDLEALKRIGETAVPETPLVTWQRVEAQVEEGLQRPWTRREPGAHGSALKYSGPQNGYSYAVTEVHSLRDVDLWVGIVADDYGRVWVNGRLVAATVGQPGGAADASEVKERVACGLASFRKGANTVVVRSDNAAQLTGHGSNRRADPRSLETYFWVKVAVRGGPLDAAAVQARQAAIAGRRAELRHLPANVCGYRRNNTAHHPEVKPVTAWDLESGRNVLWRRHLELESAGGYGSSAHSSKAPPVVLGDRLIVLGEPHFVLCLDKATGKTLWERECNILEFTAPDKVEESRRLWAAYAKARNELMKLGRDRIEREEGLLTRGMNKDEAKAEVGRVSAEVGKTGGTGKGRGGGGFFDFLMEHGQFGVSGYGAWTGYSYASPVTDGERVWVKFGTGVAAGFDRDGNRLWMARIPAEGGYTVCPSPVLAGRTLVVEAGARSERPGQERFDWDFTRLIGLDAATGQERWRTEPLFHPTVTGSPVLMKATNGREEMDVVVSQGGTLVRAEDGKILSQTWGLEAGWGSPTIGGDAVYHAAGARLLTASRPVMYDRDSAGLRPLWTADVPCEFDGGMAFADGLLYGSGGGQGPGGYVVFDTAKRKLRRCEFPGHGDRSTVWRGVPPQSNGRQYVPIVTAGDYVFIGEHGSVFHGPVARGAICGVVQRKWDGLLVAKSLVEKAWTGPPVFEGDRIYVRTDPSIVCLGYTGDEGRAFEADVNASYMLGDIETQAPEDTAPIEIPLPPATGRAPSGAEFSGYISYPIEVFGHFDIARADEVLAAFGGPLKIGEFRRETNRFEVAGQTVTRRSHANCGIYGHAAVAKNAHFRDVPFGKGAYFRATLVNDRERVVRVWAPQEPPDVWIAGQRVPEGTRVRLKPGAYPVLGRAFHTEEWPAAQGFYFRFDDSSDVAAERKTWQELLRASRPELERIARYGTRPKHVERAKQLLGAIR